MPLTIRLISEPIPVHDEPIHVHSIAHAMSEARRIEEQAELDQQRIALNNATDFVYVDHSSGSSHGYEGYQSSESTRLGEIPNRNNNNNNRESNVPISRFDWDSSRGEMEHVEEAGEYSSGRRRRRRRQGRSKKKGWKGRAKKIVKSMKSLVRLLAGGRG